MCFEFDPAKSEINRNKHGIDFYEAQSLWLDSEIVELKSSFEGEDRYLAIGTIGAKYWTAVYTYRAGKIRIISVRRSRSKEVRFYES
ncbi:MAG: BrnT family toxin [Gammaproteobacteria bacterium]|nr:BrnT family toxin [Gammaproteobacteria bacterium]